MKFFSANLMTTYMLQTLQMTSFIINSQGELIVVNHGEGSIKKDKDWNVTTLIDRLSRAVSLVIKEDGAFYVTAWGGEKVYKLKNAAAS